ncbi:MAG: DUF3857 domain-containing protein [bacterium]
MRPSSLYWAAFLLLAAPLTSQAVEWPWGEIPREELFSTYFAECPKADAIVLLDHGTVRVDAKFHLKAHRHVRTKILTDAGLDRAIVRIPLEAGEEIKDFRGHTIVPPGNEFKVEKAQMKDEPDGASRVITIAFPAAQKGAVLEWEYDVRSEQISRIEPWSFQGRDFARVSRFELQTTPGLTYDAVFRWSPGMPPAAVVATINDPDDPHKQISQSTWEMKNQPPFSAPSFVSFPEDYRITLYVQLLGYSAEQKAEVYRATVERQLSDASSSFRNFGVSLPWEDIGKGIGAVTAKLLGDASGVSDWAGAAASAGSGEPLARALFARVRDGLGTDAPKADGSMAPPRQVVAAGHGTPSEKNLVLLGLLKSHSLTADPVLVRSRPLGPFVPMWHDPSQLDRVVVRLTLDGRTLWLDAAPQSSFGTLPPESRAAKGLLAREDGGSLVDITAAAPQTSRNVATSATLDDRGTLAARSTLVLGGDRALEARRALAKDGDAAFVAGMLRARFGDAVAVDSVKVGGMAQPDSALTIEAAYHVAAYARGQGDRLQCKAPFLETITANPLPEGERKVPVELPFAGISREEVTLQLPSGILVETCPPGGSARAGDVTLKTTHATSAGSLTSTRELRVQDRRIGSEDLSGLRTFFTAAQAADEAAYAVRRQLMRATG